MKISDLLKLSTDNLRRRKGRTALTVIGVVVGTCAIVVMISLGIATNRRTDEMLSTWSDLTQIQVFSYSENPDTPALDDKMVAQFKEMENVVAATPLYNFQSMNANVVAGKKDRYSMYMYNAVGMDVDAIEPMGIELVSGSYLTGQSLGRNKIPVLVGEDTAYQFEDTKKSYRNPDRYRWKETDENGNVIKQPFFDITKETLTMQMIYEYDDQGNPKMREYELVVVGVMKTDYSKRGTEGIIMNIADMKRLEEEYKKLSKNSGMGGGSVVMYGGSSGTKVKGYDQVYVKVDDVNHVGAVEQMIKDIGYQTSSMTQYREDMQKQVASGQMMLGGLAAVSLLVAALNIANTMTMAIYERTKEIVGPYTLHDFFLYYAVRWGFSPAKVYYLARQAFAGEYTNAVLLKWLRNFYRRFFSQQFKRSCLPDGPKVGSVTLSPRGDWRMPSDASAALWVAQADALEE